MLTLEPYPSCTLLLKTIWWFQRLILRVFLTLDTKALTLSLRELFCSVCSSPSSITRLQYGAPWWSAATALLSPTTELHHWAPPWSSHQLYPMLHHRPLSLVSINELFHQAPDLALWTLRFPKQQVLSGNILIVWFTADTWFSLPISKPCGLG